MRLKRGPERGTRGPRTLQLPDGWNRNDLAGGPGYIAISMRCFLKYLRRRHRKFQRAKDDPKQYSRRNLTERCDNGNNFRANLSSSRQN